MRLGLGSHLAGDEDGDEDEDEDEDGATRGIAGPWYRLVVKLAGLLRACGLVALVIGAGAGGAPVWAAPPAESILNLHAELTVNADATADVVETILVWVAGQRITWGIDRDIPTGPGGADRMEIEDLTVTRDGQPEPFDVLRLPDMERIHLGDPGTPLTNGTHVYVLKYKTRWQLEVLGERARLTWRVAVGSRALSLEQASLVVFLPEAAAQGIDSLAASSDAAGRADPSIVISRRGGTPVFTTTRSLGTDGALTAVVTWPKGIVRVPDRAARAGRLVHTWGLVLAAALVALIQLVALMRTRARVSDVPTALVLGALAGSVASAGSWEQVLGLGLGLWFLAAPVLAAIRALAHRIRARPAERIAGEPSRRAIWGALFALLLFVAGCLLLVRFARLTSAPAAWVLMASVVAARWPVRRPT